MYVRNWRPSLPPSMSASPEAWRRQSRSGLWTRSSPLMQLDRLWQGRSVTRTPAKGAATPTSPFDAALSASLRELDDLVQPADRCAVAGVAEGLDLFSLGAP